MTKAGAGTSAVLKGLVMVTLFLLAMGHVASHPWSAASAPVHLPPPPGLGGPSGPFSPSNLPLWRWRHGYVKSDDKFFWTTIGDSWEVMDESDAGLYETFLSALPKSDRAGSRGEMEPALAFRQKEGAPAGVGSVSCRFDAWGTNVRMSFATELGEDGLLAPAGRVRWSYSRADWRRCRGYQRSPWGAYQFSPSFPRDWGAREGARIDLLMDRSIEYWVDVATGYILGRLSTDRFHLNKADQKLNG